MPPVQLPQIAPGPSDPEARYVAPSGISDAFDQLGRIGNEIADKTTAIAAQKNATIDQQAAGNNPVTIDESNFPSLYADQYNKTANLVFGATKKNQLDAGLKSIYTTNINDPTAYATAADSFKSQYMANVPSLQQANYGKDFDDLSTQYAGQVFGNNVQLTRNSAVATATTRLDTLNNSIYASALANGGNAVDLPEVQDKIAERQAILTSLTDPGHVGGPLMSADDVAKLQIGDRAQQREGELLHDFTNTPYPQQAKFVTDLEKTGDASDALAPPQFSQLIGRMKQEYSFSRGAHDMDLMQTRYDTESAIHTLALGFTPDGMGQLIAKVGASGDPILAQRLGKAIAVNSQVKDFGTQTVAQMGQQIDADTDKLNSGSGTPIDAEALQAKTRIYQMASTELATDPLKFAAARRVAPTASLAPLDLNDPNSISSRMDGVRKTEAQYGKTVNPLRPEDVRQLTTQWPTMTADQQVSTLGGLNKLNMTPQESQLVYASLDKENPSLSTISGMLKSTDTAPIAKAALDGLDYFRNNKDVVDKDGTVQREIDGQLSKLYPVDPSGQSLQSTAPLALGLYTKNAARSGTFTVPDAATAQTAAQTAVANLFGYKSLDEMPSINGKSVIPFALGMSAGTHDDIWRSTTDDDLKAANGGALPTNSFGGKSSPVTAQQITSNSFPVYTGKPGLYQIGQLDPAGNLFYLTGTNGKPFIWNAGTQAAALKQRGSTSPPDLSHVPVTGAMGQ